MEKFHRGARVLIGFFFWATAASLAVHHLRDPAEGRDRRAISGLGSYIFGGSFEVRLRFPEDVEIAAGDPIYIRGPQGVLRPAGEVRSLLRDGSPLPILHSFPGDGVREVKCAIPRDSIAGLAGEPRVRLLMVPQTMSWVFKTLIPPERMASIIREWNDFLLGEREEIFKTLNPVIAEFLREVEDVLSADLPPVLRAHQEELGAIGRRLNEEMIQKEIKPLLRTELWPIIEHRAQPAIEALMGELMKKAPLWSFTWRYIYQSLPLTSDRYLKEALARFWREDAIPILKAHSDDFLLIAQDIVREASGNRRLSEAFRLSFERLMADDELRHLVRIVFQEVVLDNPHFHESMRKFWNSPQVERSLESLSARLEPFVRKLGAEVLGTPEGGITREFASVLRTQILRKDLRWVLIDCPESEGPPGGGAAPRGPPLQPGSVLPAEVERP